MTLNCLECGEIVRGVEAHPLPRGYEQPIPYIFHQKCFQDLVDNKELRFSDM